MAAKITKQRIVCPICGNGFITNTIEEKRYIDFKFDNISDKMEHNVPACNNCFKKFILSFNITDFTITLEERDY